jgi:hypothetical protein
VENEWHWLLWILKMWKWRAVQPHVCLLGSATSKDTNSSSLSTADFENIKGAHQCNCTILPIYYYISIIFANCIVFCKPYKGIHEYFCFILSIVIMLHVVYTPHVCFWSSVKYGIWHAVRPHVCLWANQETGKRTKTPALVENPRSEDEYTCL